MKTKNVTDLPATKCQKCGKVVDGTIIDAPMFPGGPWAYLCEACNNSTLGTKFVKTDLPDGESKTFATEVIYSEDDDLAEVRCPNCNSLCSTELDADSCYCECGALLTFDPLI